MRGAGGHANGAPSAVPNTEANAIPPQGASLSEGPPGSPPFPAPDVVVTPISSTICLYRPPGEFLGPQPLVLLLPWLGAQPRAVAKYLSLYLARGWAVLVAESRLGHFLWPRWGLAYALQVLGLLGEEEKALNTHPLLIHAFSIGGYTVAQMMVHLASHPEEHASVRGRIRGVVYDSLVTGSLAEMALGVARMTSSALFRPLLRRGALLYFSLCRCCTVAHYQAALDVFRRPPLRCPVLVFYCHNDPLSDPRVVQQLLDGWQEGGIRVQVQEWQVSQHAQHLRLYPQEYGWAVAAFLQQLDLAPLGLQAKL